MHLPDRMPLPPYGGSNNETAALANALARSQVGRDGGYPTPEEPMLLGIGGGIGTLYAVLHAPEGPRFHLGTRHLAGCMGDGFLRGICQRLGIEADTVLTDSPEQAENLLVDTLSAGRHALVWTEQASLPYWRQPAELQGALAHVVGVTGFDEDTDEFELDDRASHPIPLDAIRFGIARRANPGLGHRMVRFEAPRRLLPLRKAVFEGLLTGAVAHLRPPLRNMGVPGLRTWATRLRDMDSPRGWLHTFAPGRDLFQALVAIFHGIETDGTGGGALRLVYADALLAAATVAGDPTQEQALRGLAVEARALGAWWRELAYAALPDEVPLFAEARGCLVERDGTFRRGGLDALETMTASSQRLRSIASEVEGDFPMRSGDVRAMLAGLAERVDTIADTEEALARRVADVLRA